MYDTLKSLKYAVFVDPHQGNKDVIPFSLPITKALYGVHRQGKARAYLQCIYCKVKQWIQRELSYNQIKMCMCVDIWWICMVAKLILLCSLKTYLSYETWKHLLESRGYLIHLFFQAGIWVPIVLNISDTFVSIFFSSSFFTWITFA